MRNKGKIYWPLTSSGAAPQNNAPSLKKIGYIFGRNSNQNNLFWSLHFSCEKCLQIITQKLNLTLILRLSRGCFRPQTAAVVYWRAEGTWKWPGSLLFVICGQVWWVFWIVVIEAWVVAHSSHYFGPNTLSWFLSDDRISCGTNHCLYFALELEAGHRFQLYIMVFAGMRLALSFSLWPLEGRKMLTVSLAFQSFISQARWPSPWQPRSFPGCLCRGCTWNL